jgi:hypothetical protein
MAGDVEVHRRLKRAHLANPASATVAGAAPVQTTPSRRPEARRAAAALVAARVVAGRRAVGLGDLKNLGASRASARARHGWYIGTATKRKWVAERISRALMIDEQTHVFV